MGNRGFKLFSFLVLFLTFSCASLSTRGDSRLPEVQASLLKEKISNGRLQQIFVKFPLKSKKDWVSAYETGDLTIQAEWNQKIIPFFIDQQDNDGIVFRGLLGIPYREPVGPKKISVQIEFDGYQWEQHLMFEVFEGKYKAEKLRVAPRKIKPNPSDEKRIEKEYLETRKIYQTRTPIKYWKGPFRLPIRSGVTSPYGTKRLYNKSFSGYHSGLDLRARTGAPIRAPESGKVVLAKPLFFTGGTVILDHGYGLFTVYAHLSKITVELNQILKKGDRIGLAGATGRVTGPHLHWGMTVQQAKINPLEMTKKGIR
ncbi:MAG: peptidase M23 [Bdellovibrionaceae bacterium]|nr:peptidase M23 [Pseudobdellovibrionaceae bacterium]|tara:strand:- start:8718 stop:9656 length:939 start_codon:yes stop_codon:yes gene_type:complete